MGPARALCQVNSGDSSLPVFFGPVPLRSWRDIFIWLLGLILLAIMRNRKSRPLLQAGGWGERWTWRGQRTGARSVLHLGCLGAAGAVSRAARAGAGGQAQPLAESRGPGQREEATEQARRDPWLPLSHPRPDGALATRAQLLGLAGLRLPHPPTLGLASDALIRRLLGGRGRATGLARGSVFRVSCGRVGLRPVSLESRPHWTVKGILRTEPRGVLCDESGHGHSTHMDSARA